ncbi:pyrroloquinoline quinone biosynthesis protein PqqD [Rickettsiella grylli]|uniref:pyrroloquinoline quinone biosynthesis peptide chaperone PqqD n=1 Tax=Rickettsiella grylli TaxID=59196 RepID=UPI0008FD003E|nr:pyrroloquinoline quinone biosynthesis peptide chaperone PqqD [Rickettsiella grylli]OJA00501.1 pyrroloquinoline quinone biosynthesis protein PqqD [Rickettsiella grylli]
MIQENQFNLDAPIGLASGFRLQWEKSQARYVLLYPEGMITLNTTAAEILKLCDGYRSITTIISALHTQYTHGAILHLTEDTHHFLITALQKGWLTVF